MRDREKEKERKGNSMMMSILWHPMCIERRLRRTRKLKNQYKKKEYNK